MIRVGLNDAAAAVAVQPETIRKWVNLRRISPPQDGRWYALEEIEEYAYVARSEARSKAQAK